MVACAYLGNVEVTVVHGVWCYGWPTHANRGKGGGDATWREDEVSGGGHM